MPRWGRSSFCVWCCFIHIFVSRYAYLEETGDDFDEEGISLTSSVAKITGDVAAKLDRKTDLAFGEDLEEDKRE